VLGTLRGEDRRLFEKILAHDTAIQSEVARWEQSLVTANETALQKQPEPRVWSNILDQIRQSDHAQEPGEIAATLSAPSSELSGSVHHLPSRVKPRARFWPTVAGLATAASLVLAVVVLQLLVKQEPTLRVDGVAVVLSDEGRVPYYLVETDYENGQVRVTALSPPQLEQSQNLQLWQAQPDRSSVRPVVLLPKDTGTSMILDVDSLIAGSDLFGVCIEPVGAPTNAGPTSPVVAHGDYLNTRTVY
jgi:anti-sigma-K factor RskA